MKSIEEIKIELTMKLLSGEFSHFDDLQYLPIDDELRIFVCSISPFAAYRYAYSVDKGPHDVTRTAACKSPNTANGYAYFIDKKPCEETRSGASKDPAFMKLFIEQFGE